MGLFTSRRKHGTKPRGADTGHRVKRPATPVTPLPPQVGFAVIDTETTGLWLSIDRIVEIAAVGLRPDGTVEGEWSTLLNPERDLGPTGIHHIRGRDAMRAPLFLDIAGDLAELLRGRIIVGHNISFDIRFLEEEYHRAGFPNISIPVSDTLCTMSMSSRAFPGTPRSLETCCQRVGIFNEAAHSALGDARVTAALLQRLAPRFGGMSQLSRAHHRGLMLPKIQPRGSACVQRSDPGERDEPFLARIANHATSAPKPDSHNTYLGVLDRVLIDRLVSAREADELVQVASELGIDRETARALNDEYLLSLARAALADGALSDEELNDLSSVAAMLGLGPRAVESALDRASSTQETLSGSPHQASAFTLAVGDAVVFTGETLKPREELMQLSEDAGLVPRSSVSRKTTVLVAADPDSLSTKARKAAELGIPIVTEDAFLKLLGSVVATREPTEGERGRSRAATSAEKGGIVTTENEMEGFRVVRAIVASELDWDRVVLRDTKSYCGVLVDDSNRKQICRLHFNHKQKYLGLLDERKNETRVPIESVGDIYQHSDALREAARRLA